MTVHCPICKHDITHNMTVGPDGSSRVYWCYRCGRNIVVKDLPSYRHNPAPRVD
jgi:transposase-like protein